MQGILGRAVGWVISLAMFVAVIAAGWWLLTHPTTAAGVVLTVVNGVVTFVKSIVSGIGGLL